jgi:hypothetical protein
MARNVNVKVELPYERQRTSIQCIIKADDNLLPGINDRKLIAVDSAIQSIGVEVLFKLRQEDRKHRVINEVSARTQLNVSDRYVRQRWAKRPGNSL